MEKLTKDFMNYEKRIFDLFLFLVIFTSVNKIFKPFTFDLRYVTVILSLVLLLLRGSEIIKNRFYFRNYLIVLYAWSIISVLILFLYFKNYNSEVLMNLIILHSSLLLYLIVFQLYNERITIRKIYRSFTFSMLVLFVSMLFVIFIDRDISVIHGFDYNAWVPQKNFFGSNIRVGGYAQDPNYASLWIVIYISFIFYMRKKNKINTYCFFAIVVLSFFLYMYAASKTILLGLVVSAIFLFLQKRMLEKERYKLFILLKKSIIYLVPILMIVAVANFRKYLPFSQMDTMSTRYNMWEEAVTLFYKNPIFGTGLSAFRNYFEQIGNWYVHSHSTIFQLLSELGIIGIFLYLRQMEKWMMIQNPYLQIIIIIVFLSSITHELLYLPYFMFLEILSKVMKESQKKEKTDVYVVNTLKGGGAENVVSTLARQSSLEGSVPSIISMDNVTELDFPYEHYYIGTSISNKLLKFLVSRVKYDLSIQEIFLKKEVLMITNHLPRTQLIALGQISNTESSYVVHGSFQLFSDKKWIQCAIAHLLLTNKTVGVVSQEIFDEIIAYRVRSNDVFLIYNPFDFENIKEKSLEPVKGLAEINEYFLYVGRLDSNKNPFQAIEIFMEYLKENTDLKFVMLGDGEDYQVVKSFIEENELQDRIYLKGFVENPYPYIKNAQMVISSSKSEAQPMNVIESLYLGTPIVGTHSGNWVDILFDGQMKKFFPSNNTEDIVDVIDSALDFNDFYLLKFDKFESSAVLKTYRKLFGIQK